VTLAPGESKTLGFQNSICDVMGGGKYVLTFTGTLGVDPNAEIVVPFPIPNRLAFCKAGLGTGQFQARVDGALVADLHIDEQSGCRSFDFNSQSPVELTFVPDDNSYLIPNATVPNTCAFPSPCTIVPGLSGYVAAFVIVEREPMASVNLSALAQDWICSDSNTGSCDWGPLSPSPTPLSVVVATLQWGYGTTIADEQLLAGAADTSVAPLPFVPKRPPPLGDAYVVKLCPAALWPRQDILHVEGMIHGQPLNENWDRFRWPSLIDLNDPPCDLFELDNFAQPPETGAVLADYCSGFTCFDGPEGFCR
jgi:hypothetical protein